MSNLNHQPTITSYGDCNDPRCLVVEIGPVRVWFSYTTPVAFKVDGLPQVVRDNAWSRTTGRHLNTIDGGDRSAKAARVSGEVFQALWNEQAAPVLSSAWTAAATATKTPAFLELARSKRKLDRPGEES